LTSDHGMEVIVMGLGSIGIPSMILILVIALIIFGPKKLPEIGKAAGQTLKEFKTSAKSMLEDEADDEIEKSVDSNESKE